MRQNFKRLDIYYFYILLLIGLVYWLFKYFVHVILIWCITNISQVYLFHILSTDCLISDMILSLNFILFVSQKYHTKIKMLQLLYNLDSRFLVMTLFRY